ncbi:hypothetical protein FHT10_000454 [Xanthomonas arboricola]|nr:hypothetical protein [Xanthomonas cannabis]
MDAAIEPPRTDSRRVPRAVRAPRPRPGLKIAKRLRYEHFRRLNLIARYGQIRQRADHLRLCCRVLARPPSRDTLQVRPCKLRGGIHAAKGPATVGGQGPVEMVGLHGFQQQLANCDAVSLLFNKTARLFNKTTSQLYSVVSSPIAGPCGGMDAAIEPIWTYWRRVPRAVRAPRPRPDLKIAKRSRHAQCRRRYLIG